MQQGLMTLHHIISVQQHTADVGVLPVRRRRHQVLMDALVGGERSDPASLFGSPRSSSQSPSPERGEQ